MPYSIPCISVIIPCFGVELFLPKCLQSVWNQSLTDFELFLVDDGSYDRSGVLAEEALLTDPRALLIHKANGGLSDARNAALDLSRGSFLTFIDSDDFVARDYLKAMHDALANTNLDFAQCNVTYLYDDGHKSIRRPHQKEVISFSAPEAIDSFFTDGMENGINVMAWGKIFRAELFLKLRFPFGRIHEDDYTVCDIVTKAIKNGAIVIPDVLYFYYQRASGLSKVKSPKEIADRFFIFLHYLQNVPYNHLSTKQHIHYFVFTKVLHLITILNRDINYRRAILCTIPILKSTLNKISCNIEFSSLRRYKRRKQDFLFLLALRIHFWLAMLCIKLR